jgi:putative transposase
VSIRTIALTLKPTPTEAAALTRLQAAFNDACNYVSGVAWEAQEFNSVRLHRLAYYDVRATYGLLAQHAVRAIGVVADSYRADKTIRHTFKPTAAVVLDTPRLYRIEHNRAGIATLDGRIKVEMNIGGIQRRQLADAVKLAEADLVRDHKGRWRLLVSAHYTDPPPMGTDGVLGVDLGRIDIAVTSEGDTFSGAHVTVVRDRYTRNRRNRQRKASQGTRSTRRRVRATQKRLSGRESRFQRNINHTISKRIVANAVETTQVIACEDLTGIRERTNTQARAKGERRQSNRWAFYQLRTFLAYKCVAAGVPFVLVNPAYTSQMCHCCLHIGERCGKRFACINPTCCWAGDADYNGALNIALLGMAVTHPGGPALCCLYQPDARATESPRL